MSLIEIIEANENIRFLSEKKTWEVAQSLIKIIKELHGKNLIYRDLKPDNILVSLENASGCFSLNKFSIVAGDLETVTSEGVEEDKWYGSPMYFPKDTSKEKQRKPYDIYTLGKILDALFSKNFEYKMYMLHLHSFISRMKDEDFEKRPPIQEVESFFTSLYPRYLDLVDENPDCLGMSDCAIL
jgi:serine/threonine protein kinase